ncbi:UbiA family prenyltransferase [Nonomuraea sp. NBC_00507]|uniref:SCO3242 family prenyltransferase n=1 Tax=Nonomuraea sp. NBC_00507 TaxID=2976002 RepID=UPI002E19F641
MNDGARALLELVRAPAAVSVPGDTMAGAAAAGVRWAPGLGVASTLLYWSGMALNDWADREADALDRPERPIPSGRVAEGRALAMAAGLTGAGLAVAALSGGRRALATAGLLAGAVWAYDLRLKHTAAGPAAMATCRALDVLLGAAGRSGAAGTGARGWASALPVALAVGAHTYGISILGRAEVKGATPATVRGALATTAAATGLAAAACLPALRTKAMGPRRGEVPDRVTAVALSGEQATAADRMTAVALSGEHATAADRVTAVALLAGYAALTATAVARLRVTPGPDQVRQAVRLGILALLPLQATAVASRGRRKQAGALLAAHPVGRWLSARMATS